ncbi:CocE/NonD family hydrolase [Sphingomonas sp.]|uniref:CocE/NonD family hydrolase n=1 Tax=Sphingomonas sp. TaxID=28214 RepID=UPI0025DD5FB9|nr:CocE/NonD family hydrolase [Sphingomonas sp.]MBV9527596.1 CocE/NonD family hydrolase [Sphingomonas sp.]
MKLRTAATAIAALALASPLSAQTQSPPQSPSDIQPGGDIPSKFHPVQVAPIPKGGDIPTTFSAPRTGYQYTRRTALVPMRDGARLYVVLIIPKGVRNAPIMLDRTPYSADKLTSRGAGGPQLDDILFPAYAELARAGYIIAAEDVRGKYKSEGDYVMNRPVRGALNSTAVDHSTDAYDTIDWLVKNVPESNGRVGTIGTSYDGFTTLMSLVGPHPALKAAVPINPMVDVWKGDDWFHNGAFRQEMISYIYSQTATKSSDESWFTNAYDDYTTYLRYGSAGAYGNAMGMQQLPFWNRLTQHPAYDGFWQGQAVDRILARAPLTVPTLFVDSEWDQEDIYGAPAAFAATKGSPNAHLVLGPWHHGEANSSASTLGPLDWGSDTGKWFRQTVMMPFLNQYLKDGPPADIARVTAFQAGTNQWQRLPDWPLACASGCTAPLTPLYLAPGRQLSVGAPAGSGFDSYVSDPARPVTYRARPNASPYSGGSTWRFWLEDDQRFAEARPDVLSYESEPLVQPLKLTGQPTVHLVASTSGTDGDWVVKLIDVYPDQYPQKPEMGGYELAIAMDVLRGRYRDDPANPTPVPANKPVTYQFALPSVDYVLQPGHRLMVQIQSSWFPLYDRNPQTYVPNIFFAKASDYRAATQKVFSGANGSWVGLPIVH